jgi:hypothetical protein
MTINIVMYFPKSSYLSETFSKKLSELSTAGIVNYWIKKYADMRFLNIKTVNYQQKKLNLEKLAGVFNIWLIGLAVGLFAFIVEVCFEIKKRV